jgi:hypothetical protein
VWVCELFEILWWYCQSDDDLAVASHTDDGQNLQKHTRGEIWEEHTERKQENRKKRNDEKNVRLNKTGNTKNNVKRRQLVKTQELSEKKKQTRTSDIQTL